MLLFSFLSETQGHYTEQFVWNKCRRMQSTDTNRVTKALKLKVKRKGKKMGRLDKLTQQKQKLWLTRDRFITFCNSVSPIWHIVLYEYWFRYEWHEYVCVPGIKLWRSPMNRPGGWNRLNENQVFFPNTNLQNLKMLNQFKQEQNFVHVF